jgi:hypothetical protein
MTKPKAAFVFAVLTSPDRDRCDVILPRPATRREYEALQREISRACWRVVGRRRKSKAKGRR